VDDEDEAAPLGAPGTRPRECWRYLSRDAAINNAETSLRFSVVAQTRCGASDIPIEDARVAIAAAAGVQADDLLLRHFFSENFIVLYGSQAVKDQVLRVSPLPIGSTALVLRPWTKLRHAEASALRYRVSLVLKGIPPHAWREDTAAKILTPSCWIQEIDASTRAGDDLSAFKVTAWTAHPSYIPVLCWLGIPKDDPPCRLFAGGPALPPYLREKKNLAYKVLIHIKSVADFNPRPPSPGPKQPDSSDDSDNGFDQFANQGNGPRIHSFAFDRGIPDGDADGGRSWHATGGTIGRSRSRGGTQRHRAQTSVPAVDAVHGFGLLRSRGAVGGIPAAEVRLAKPSNPAAVLQTKEKGARWVGPRRQVWRAKVSPSPRGFESVGGSLEVQGVVEPSGPEAPRPALGIPRCVAPASADPRSSGAQEDKNARWAASLEGALPPEFSVGLGQPSRPSHAVAAPAAEAGGPPADGVARPSTELAAASAEQSGPAPTFDKTRCSAARPGGPSPPVQPSPEAREGCWV